MTRSAAAPLRVVLASNNAKKLAELQAMFSALALQLIRQGDLGVPEADEPFQTFIENGLAKARHAAAATGCAAIADDSGLCVDALGGAPGVNSARYAGVVTDEGDREARRQLQDRANNRLLYERLKQQNNRHATFVCTLVAVRGADDPQPLIAVGRWPGQILHAPQGEGGFGYDPMVFIPGLGCAAAELSAEEKNKHSHRAIAATAMLSLLREVWRL
jgi:XTP/dITP diphosphohydrolase